MEWLVGSNVASHRRAGVSRCLRIRDGNRQSKSQNSENANGDPHTALLSRDGPPEGRHPRSMDAQGLPSMAARTSCYLRLPDAPRPESPDRVPPA